MSPHRHTTILHWRLLLLLFPLHRSYIRSWFRWFWWKTEYQQQWHPHDECVTMPIVSSSQHARVFVHRPIRVRFPETVTATTTTTKYQFYDSFDSGTWKQTVARHETEQCHSKIDFAFIKRRTVHCWSSRDIHWFRIGLLCTKNTYFVSIVQTKY